MNSSSIVLLYMRQPSDVLLMITVHARQLSLYPNNGSSLTNIYNKIPPVTTCDNRKSLSISETLRV